MACGAFPHQVSHWIHTMYRCTPSSTRRALLALTLGAAAAAIAPLAQAQAVVQRPFPQNALRGSVEFGAPPWVKVNGQPVQLAPGARVRGLDNMLVMTASLVGQSYAVNYTVEPGGLVRDVWLLRPDEIARAWPSTPDEARRMSFDPASQTWVRP
jgi:hypothetical protein